jgi:hypothetical protein
VILSRVSMVVVLSTAHYTAQLKKFSNEKKEGKRAKKAARRLRVAIVAIRFDLVYRTSGTRANRFPTCDLSF